MGHHDLKVDGDLKVEGHAKIEHHLEVDGHLNFGQKSVTCVATAGVASVNVNSASGTVFVSGLTTNTGDFNNLLTVHNDKVCASSVVLLTFISPSNSGPLPIIGLTSVTDGSFVVGIATGSTSTTLTFNFLVC